MPVKFVETENQDELYIYEVDLGELGKFWLREPTWKELQEARAAYTQALSEYGIAPDIDVQEVLGNLSETQRQELVSKLRELEARRLAALIVRWDSEREITPENVAVLPSVTRRLLARAEDKRLAETPAETFS